MDETGRPALRALALRYRRHTPYAEFTTEEVPVYAPARDAAPRALMGLAILWSRTEPHRVGEVALADDVDEPFRFGRATEGDGLPLALVRQRGGENVACGPIMARTISRVQLLVRAGRKTVEVENVGRCDLYHNGSRVQDVRADIGDVLQIGSELTLLVVERPAFLPAYPLPADLVPRFGQPDGVGIVGESPAAWELRRQLAFAANRNDHVLVTGASGSGKELVARALHRLSPRTGGPLVSRSAATLPDSLIDAELFGNVRDYPNPGMAERPGLVGAADGGTLFLDEIGELSHGLQAHLLRVLDSGEYQRLGEARSRVAQFRLVAATNRALDELKHDLAARIRLRLAVPGLDRRREDIPLIARHLLRAMATRDEELAGSFFHGGDPDGEPRWTARFVASLVTAPYTTHVRQLASVLWEAMLHSRNGVLDELPAPSAAVQGVRLAESSQPVPQAPAASMVDPRSLGPAELRAALEACGGVQEQAWRKLGLRSRHQLVRLIRKHGLASAGRSA